MKRLSIMIACSLLAVVQPASAATILTTYYGKIAEGYDRTGVFGAPETNLAGLDAVFTFLFDTDTPGAYYNSTSTGSQLSGGSRYDIGSPGSATVTIGGKTASIGGAYESYLARKDSGSYQEIDNFAQDFAGPPGGMSNWVHGIASSTTNDFVGGAGLLSDIDYKIATGTATLADFQFYDPGKGFVGSVQATGKMIVDRVTIQAFVAPVPEPSTWLMMIVGLGFVGAALRRKKTVSDQAEKGLQPA